MSLILDGTTGVPVTTVTGTLPVANGGTGVATSTGSGANVLGTSPSISGAVMTTMASSVLTSATAQNSTSGTSIDFTGIPSWVKRITVMFSGVSVNGTSGVLIQLGVSGTPETTGYSAMCATVTTTNNTTRGTTFTTGFPTAYANGAADSYSGSMVFTLLSSNTWTCMSTLYDAPGPSIQLISGVKGLAGTLNMVRLTTVNGTDTFDAGSINILYE